jgi:EmrB/QacA subfamily drug resistance transporter
VTTAQKAPEETGPTARRPPYPVRPLAVVLLATFMNQFGVTAVTVAVPTMQRELGTSYASVQWVVAGYLLPFALLLVSGGRLGDIIGRRRSFLWGTAGFTLAALLAGVAGDIRLLIAARVLQGMAAAVMSPQVLAAYRTLVPSQRRGPVLAAYAAVISLAVISGPLLGGLLVQADIFGWGWRSIFLLNVPLGVLVVLGGFRYLPESGGGVARRLDLGQAALVALTVLLLIYPLMEGREQGWPWWAWASLVASLPTFAIFLAYQRHRERVAGSDAALIPLRLFRETAFSVGLLANFIVAALITGFFFVFVVFLQVGLGYSAAHMGVTMVPWALGTALGSIAAIPLSRAMGRRTLLFGAVLMGCGIGGLALAVWHSGTALSSGGAFPGLFVFGIGVTMVSAPILNITLAAIPHVDAGVASGVFNTFRQTGSAFGIAVSGAVYFGWLGSQATASKGSYVEAIQHTMVLYLACCLLVLVLVLRLPRHVTQIPDEQDAEAGPARVAL